MRHETARLAVVAAALGWLLPAAPALAQHREYYIRGRVLDTQRQPIPGVEIGLHDAPTSRRFGAKTDDQGVFKLAGLPHGVYQVSFEKDGYLPVRTEWDFDTPQDTMQRVEVSDTVLLSQAQVEQTERVEKARSGFKAAVEQIHNGDYDHAIGLLQGFVEKNPEDVNALFFLGFCYVKTKMCREAVELLTRVTELQPTLPGAHFELGVCHRQLGDLPKALQAYGELLRLDPGHAGGAYNSGLILFETNRVDEALARFQTGLAVKPDDPELLEMAGRCYIHQADFEAAVEHLEKARRGVTDPDKLAFLEQLIREAKALIP